MIIGTHVLFYSTNADADRAFFKDVLRLRSVDAGEGWLIFALPPAEGGVHPSESGFHQEHTGRRMMGAVIYLMCDNLRTQMKLLEARKVKCTKIEEAPWGLSTSITMPSGAEIGLYQPTHPTALKAGV